MCQPGPLPAPIPPSATPSLAHRPSPATAGAGSARPAGPAQHIPAPHRLAAARRWPLAGSSTKPGRIGPLAQLRVGWRVVLIFGPVPYAVRAIRHKAASDWFPQPDPHLCRKTPIL